MDMSVRSYSNSRTVVIKDLKENMEMNHGKKAEEARIRHKGKCNCFVYMEIGKHSHTI